MVRIGYDTAEVDERLADLQTRLAASLRRSAALEEMLRSAVAQATQLLHTLDDEPPVAGHDERTSGPQLVRARESVRANSTAGADESLVAESTASAAAAESNALREEGAPAGKTGAMGEQPMAGDVQWVNGTIREVSRTEAGATIWVVPEDQPQSVVSFFFTNDSVGREAVEFVCGSFGAGETVRVWHRERSGLEIEHI
jgi:hypothetical protein